VGRPRPALFSAETRNKYEFPSCSLRTWADSLVVTPHSVHVAPPASTARVTSHFSMMYWMTGEPPSVSGHCHDRSTESLLYSTTDRFRGDDGTSATHAPTQVVQQQLYMHRVNIKSTPSPRLSYVYHRFGCRVYSIVPLSILPIPSRIFTGRGQKVKFGLGIDTTVFEPPPHISKRSNASVPN